MKSIWELLDKKESYQKIKIGKAASKLFNNKGYLQTSMKDIATEAKVSKGGIFHYFATKDEILHFILNNYLEFALENLEQELKEMTDTPLKIKFIISRHLDFYLKNLYEGKTLFQDAHLLPPKHFKVIAAKERKYYRILAGVLSDFFNGRIQKSKLALASFALIGMCNWIFSWYNTKGSITPEELPELIYDIFYRGINGCQQIWGNRSRGKRGKKFDAYQQLIE